MCDILKITLRSVYIWTSVHESFSYIEGYIIYCQDLLLICY